MKIFNWLRSRSNNGNEGSCKKPRPPSIYDNLTRMQPCKDEFSDWPSGLLAIGTFGNDSNLKGVEDPSPHLENNAAPDGFEEAVDKEDLKALLNNCVVLDDSIEKLLDSLRGEEKTTCDELVHSGSKDVRENDKGSNISKKSLTYLLKKAFLCKGGFAPAPIVRDLLPDPKLDTSRLEKILRAMLHKKIYPQRSTRPTTPQRYLDKPEMGSYEEELVEEETCPIIKWDKTDSEYIVLEI